MSASRDTSLTGFWTPEERESFFAAIARHRRAAWQVTAISTLCIALLALILAVLTAPLFYALIGLVLDLINLVTPMPDLLGSVMKSIGALADAPEPVSIGQWVPVLLKAALPGLCAFAVFAYTLRRLVREAETGSLSHLAQRTPDASKLAEQRLANVVAEMAIAANVPAPRVLVAPRATAEAAVFGASEDAATIVVTSGFLERLDRSSMQAAAGHLVGLLANGDVPQGLRIAQSLSVFGFVARLSDGIVDPPKWRRLWSLTRKALRRGASSEDTELILELTNPLGGSSSDAPASAPTGTQSNKLTWREWVRMPLYGPIVIAGFFGGLVSLAVLQPLIALAWRRRKYMADAIALQFTRDPDAVASALQKLNGGPFGALPAWSAHMSIIHPGSSRGLFGGLPMFPSLERRLKALGSMGADVRIRVHKAPGWVWFAGVPIAIVIAGLLGTAIVLLVFVSVALSGLFTWVPTMILHALLRM